MHFIHAQDVPYLARLHSGVTLSDLSERGVQAKYAYNFNPVKQPFLASFICFIMSGPPSMSSCLCVQCSGPPSMASFQSLLSSGPPSIA